MPDLIRSRCDIVGRGEWEYRHLRTNSDDSIAFSRFLPRDFKELQNQAGDLAFRSPMSRHEAGRLARKVSK